MRRSVATFTRPVSLSHAEVRCGSIMVGHRYWMPPPRQFLPMFQVFISNQLLCYIQSGVCVGGGAG